MNKKPFKQEIKDNYFSYILAVNIGMIFGFGSGFLIAMIFDLTDTAKLIIIHTDWLFIHVIGIMIASIPLYIYHSAKKTRMDKINKIHDRIVIISFLVYTVITACLTVMVFVIDLDMIIVLGISYNFMTYMMCCFTFVSYANMRITRRVKQFRYESECPYCRNLVMVSDHKPSADDLNAYRSHVDKCRLNQ